MTTSEFVSNVILLSEGKLPTFTSGATKWLRIVAQGNFFLQEFARERGVDWNRYYDPAYAIGTVSATDTYAIDEEVRKLSMREGDAVRITHTDDRVSYYTLVPHDQLQKYNYGSYVTKVGSNLKFNTAFTSSNPQFGGSITVPVYLYPETFSADNDEIDHDNPSWLVYVVAADRVKNDVTRKDLRTDLVNQANEAMMALKEENGAQVNELNMPWNPMVNDNGDW